MVQLEFDPSNSLQSVIAQLAEKCGENIHGLFPLETIHMIADAQ
jgi:hypothetical protein